MLKLSSWRALYSTKIVFIVSTIETLFLLPPFSPYYFESYRKWLAVNGHEPEWFCLDSGAVLAAYGLRDCNDLDFLYYKNKAPFANIPGIENHNHQLKYHPISLDEILFDPTELLFL